LIKYDPYINLIEIDQSKFSNYELLKYIYSFNDMNIFTFDIKKYDDNKIEIKLDISKYKYLINDISDINNITNFLVHAKISRTQLIEIYKTLKSYLKINLLENNLTNYTLNCRKNNNYGTITIKNSLYIFYYNDTTKYTYSSIKKLLQNPLIKQFKKSKYSFICK
jgi:hypothetical protein